MERQTQSSSSHTLANRQPTSGDSYRFLDSPFVCSSVFSRAVFGVWHAQLLTEGTGQEKRPCLLWFLATLDFLFAMSGITGDVRSAVVKFDLGPLALIRELCLTECPLVHNCQRLSEGLSRLPRPASAPESILDLLWQNGGFILHATQLSEYGFFYSKALHSATRS